MIKLGFLSKLAEKLGLIKPKMPEKVPFIAVYSLMILDSLSKKSVNLDELKKAINKYPEDTHREGFVCKSMTNFVAVFSSFALLQKGIEKQFVENGGRKSTESQRDSMEKLESWYED
ncbi:MAG: hypothetical protein GQ548_01255 [Methylophaga sp.]|nr:hypothetical protein [Methylophaga sp.]